MLKKKYVYLGIPLMKSYVSSIDKRTDKASKGPDQTA